MKQELMLFSYDFPHFKSQEILMRLIVEGYPVKYVIGAPWKKLSRPETTYRDAPSFSGAVPVSAICERFGIEYVVLDHASEECAAFIKERPVPIGIIAGAQILKPHVIEPFSGGVINTHEAMLPWIRGLDTLKWSIYYDLPMANSIHFIDSNIDEGKLIYQEKVALRPDDTLIDISLRFMQMKPETLVKALQVLERGEELIPLAGRGGRYCKIMPPELIQETLEKFPAWLKKYEGPAEKLNPFAEPYATIGRNPEAP